MLHNISQLVRVNPRLYRTRPRSSTLYDGAKRFSEGPSICGCPIWDLLFVPARYGAQFRGRLLGPRDCSLPLTGVTAHARPRLNVPRL
eukprot:1623491-Prymnesium_polylepis.1